MASNEEVFAAMTAKMQNNAKSFGKNLLDASAALVKSEVVEALTKVYDSKLDSQILPQKEQKSIVRGKQ